MLIIQPSPNLKSKFWNICIPFPKLKTLDLQDLNFLAIRHILDDSIGFYTAMHVGSKQKFPRIYIVVHNYLEIHATRVNKINAAMIMFPLCSIHSSTHSSVMLVSTWLWVSQFMWTLFSVSVHVYSKCTRAISFFVWFRLGCRADSERMIHFSLSLPTTFYPMFARVNNTNASM